MSDLSMGLKLTMYGMGTTFLVIILFTILIKVLAKIFSEE